LDTSDPADRMTSAAAIMTRILNIPSSSCSRQLNRTSFTFPDAGLSARAWLIHDPKVCRAQALINTCLKIDRLSDERARSRLSARAEVAVERLAAKTENDPEVKRSQGA
jgi:hypothetical protein